MGLAKAVRGAAAFPWLRELRAAYDFDAEGLDRGRRLDRLQYAVRLAREAACTQWARDELGFALCECRELQRLMANSPEPGDPDQSVLAQRMERVRRILLHYEGRVSRLNRIYWWVPFMGLLVAMVGCSARSLLGL